jgi:uncharacterized protein YegL
MRPNFDELNDGILAYRDDVLAEDRSATSVEIAVVTFGGRVETVCDFTLAKSFQPPQFTECGGDTPMGAAITQGLTMLRRRKDLYKSLGLGYYRPWMFLITDGEPTDSWQGAAEQVRQKEATKEVVFFAVAVEGANLEVLRRIAVRPPVKLKEHRWREMFLWLSATHKAVSRSTPGESVPLPPVGWGSV